MDNLIHVSTTRGIVRMSKELGVLCFFLRQLRCWIGSGNFLAENDFRRALGPHHRDFRCGPRENQVSSNVT